MEGFLSRLGRGPVPGESEGRRARTSFAARPQRGTSPSHRLHLDRAPASRTRRKPRLNPYLPAVRVPVRLRRVTAGADVGGRWGTPVERHVAPKPSYRTHEWTPAAARGTRPELPSEQRSGVRFLPGAPGHPREPSARGVGPGDALAMPAHPAGILRLTL